MSLPATYTSFQLVSVQLIPRSSQKMPHLENVSWLAQHPVPPAIAAALSKAPSFTTLVLHDFGVDSLPSLLPLAGKIKRFHLSTERKAPNAKEIVKLCPDLPGLKRRSKMPWNQRNVATLEEQREVFFRHLPAVLRQASTNLQELCIDGVGIVEGEKPFPWLQKLFDAMTDDNRQYPTFPRLSGLWLRHCNAKNIAFAHFINSAAQSLRFLEIYTAEHAALQAPRAPLPLLQELCVQPRNALVSSTCRADASSHPAASSSKTTSLVSTWSTASRSTPLCRCSPRFFAEASSFDAYGCIPG